MCLKLAVLFLIDASDWPLCSFFFSLITFGVMFYCDYVSQHFLFCCGLTVDELLRGALINHPLRVRHLFYLSGLARSFYSKHYIPDSRLPVSYNLSDDSVLLINF